MAWNNCIGCSRPGPSPLDRVLSRLEPAAAPFVASDWWVGARMTIVTTPEEPGHKEFPVSHKMIHRSIAFCLSAVLTLAMLGGIDQLAQRDDAAGQWAQHVTPRA